jgi:hypothetical protein
MRYHGPKGEQSMKKAFILAPILILGVALTGCGGSNNGNGLLGRDNPRLRAVDDFSDVASVNATSDNGSNPNVTLLLNQAFEDVGAYMIVADGTRTINFINASNSVNIASDVDNLHLDNFYTIIGTGSGPSGRKLILLSDTQTVAQNATRVRFINANEDDASVDMYVTSTATANLTGQTAQDSAVAYADNTPTYATFTPGTFTVWVTPAGTPGTVLAKKNITFNADTVITLVFLKTSSSTDIQNLLDDPGTKP